MPCYAENAKMTGHSELQYTLTMQFHHVIPEGMSGEVSLKKTWNSLGNQS